MNDFRVKDLFGYLNGLDNIFDVVRVVDPKIKEIVYQNGESDNIIHGVNCYEYWEKGQACDNCISEKAMKEKRTISKIEYKVDSVYLVMSTPIISGDELYIVEMIKEITQAILLADEEYKKKKGKVYKQR